MAAPYPSSAPRHYQQDRDSQEPISDTLRRVIQNHPPANEAHQPVGVGVPGLRPENDVSLGYKSRQPGYGPVASMAVLYPKYYKPVGTLTEIDVYAVHKLFDIKDPSGAIHHASKKLLLAGQRTGSKSQHKDIREARDTLNRWLELNPEPV